MRTTTFDFDLCPVNEPRKRWLRANWNKKVSEEEFVAAWQGLRMHSKAKHKGSRNYPARARHEYRNLVKKFGFFV